MGKPSQYQQFMDILQSNETIRSTLQELGFFAKNYVERTSIPNHLWTNWGYSADDMSFDYSWVDNIHPADKTKVLMQTTDVVEKSNCEVMRSSYRFKKKSGEYAWVISAGKFISYTDDGQPEIFIGAEIDITSIKETEIAFAEAKKKAEKLAAESEALVKIGATISSSLEFSETSSVILNEIAKIVPHDLSALFLLEDDDLKIVGLNLSRDSQSGKELIGKRIKLGDKNSFSRLIFKYKKSILCDDIEAQFPYFKHLDYANELGSIIGVPLISRGRMIGLLAVGAFEKHGFDEEKYETLNKFSDNIAVALDNAILHEKMSQIALTDPLTNLNNRHGLTLHWKTIYEQATRYKRPISLLMVDIDYFKGINDKYGHDIGDLVIKRVSSELLCNTRSIDIVSRFGGEEFVVVLPETEEHEATALAEKLRDKINQVDIDDVSENISVSIGVSTRKSNADTDLSTLIKLADQQLYKAKEEGRNKVCSLCDGTSI